MFNTSLFVNNWIISKILILGIIKVWSLNFCLKFRNLISHEILHKIWKFAFLVHLVSARALLKYNREVFFIKQTIAIGIGDFLISFVILLCVLAESADSENNHNYIVNVIWKASP